MSDSASLVSFLGTGSYQPTRYVFGGKEAESETPYIALALARAIGATETLLLATGEAEASHGKSIRQAFASGGLAEPRIERLLDGRTEEELWENFRRLHALVARSTHARLVLDITHGFRSQPFFAAATVSFARALGGRKADITIVYGAFDARSTDNRTPVWDLTPFVDLLDWLHALRSFADSGDAKAIGRLLEPRAREAGRLWAQGGRVGEQPRLKQFARALERFSAVLLALRTGELLLSRDGEPSAAARLLEACRAAREDISRRIPPLGEALAEIEKIALPLAPGATDLSGEDGKRLMVALAKLYLCFGRLAEAAVALREGWVNLYAAAAACRPGLPDYDEEARARAERAWTEASPHHRAIAGLRNDIEHGGFKARPLPAAAIHEQLVRFVQDLEKAVLSPAAQAVQRSRTWFVSRHPGAVEWAERRGLRVERCVAHLDVSQVAAGDTVIGTLPINLAAEVCARGAQYLNLSLELPEEARGRELSADELERCGARLEAYTIVPVGRS